MNPRSRRRPLAVDTSVLALVTLLGGFVVLVVSILQQSETGIGVGTTIILGSATGGGIGAIVRRKDQP